jgi:hypothetical protein
LFSCVVAESNYPLPLDTAKREKWYKVMEQVGCLSAAKAQRKNGTVSKIEGCEGGLYEILTKLPSSEGIMCAGLRLK